MIGVDPSAQLAGHRAGARRGQSGLAIDYRAGAGRAPARRRRVRRRRLLRRRSRARGQDLDAVVRETARVLKPGGLYLYDTINRTRLSKLVVIKLSQEWAVHGLRCPANLHDWDQFITPAELRGTLARHRPATIVTSPGCRRVPPRPCSGAPAPPAEEGKISYAEFGRRASFDADQEHADQLHRPCDMSWPYCYLTERPGGVQPIAR